MNRNENYFVVTANFFRYFFYSYVLHIKWVKCKSQFESSGIHMSVARAKRGQRIFELEAPIFRRTIQYFSFFEVTRRILQILFKSLTAITVLQMT